ncbi:coagulation factor III, tissue factor a [Pundamilia nyererei]|uniref:Tissue factor n=1 Tax=Pundamilia nyererei TaxID=303518 RepID=A0A9Y3S194_9CICH|nr:PREDICTED: tissue factor [Pundamilia nyererei]
MATTRIEAGFYFLYFSFFPMLLSASGSYPQAQNVTWKSTNFKTVLVWEPKPSADYSYTVELSPVGGNAQRITNCIRSSQTMCDLSTAMTDPKACYVADVLSQPPQGATSELSEFPHKTSPKFCPYDDTELDRPKFTLEVSEGSATLNVTDSPTAIANGHHLQTLRDIFSERLHYRVTYWKNKSTGKKTSNYNTSMIKVTGLDHGESYCFQVQAYIPSRTYGKQLGDLSAPQCSKDENQTIIEVYSPAVIISAIILILLLTGIIITVTVVCCKRKKKAANGEKKGVV